MLDIRQVPLTSILLPVLLVFRVYLLFRIKFMIILSIPQNRKQMKNPVEILIGIALNLILIWGGYYYTESSNPRTCYTIPFAQMAFYVLH